jgi:hypothetical protein
VTGLARGRILATGKALLIRLRCNGSAACAGNLEVSASGRGKHRSPRMLAKGPYSLPTQQVNRLKLPLSKAGRNLVASYRHQRGRPINLRARLNFDDSGRPSRFELTRPIHLKR